MALSSRNSERARLWSGRGPGKTRGFMEHLPPLLQRRCTYASWRHNIVGETVALVEDLPRSDRTEQAMTTRSR